MGTRTLLCWLVFFAGCGGKGGEVDSGETPPEAGNPLVGHERGGLLYAEMCAVCHGEIGEGGLGPVLQSSPRQLADLTDYIDRKMPLGNPERCDAECAREVAAFVHGVLTPEGLACPAVPPSPRRLRLLTRRELAATLADLEARHGCGSHTFGYDPGNGTPGSVIVAGSFNGWASTTAAGGFALTRDASSGRWRGTFAVGEGTHSYKLVVDGQWMADPGNPSTSPDGFGGVNSMLQVDCGGAAVAAAMRAFPPETRPDGFFFDDDADAQVVTAAHVEAHLAAGAVAAKRLAVHATDVADLGLLVFRRPLSSAERARYQGLVDEHGMEAAVTALLSSPHFLYRSELGEATGDGKTYRLTAWEMASALSYTYWGTMPDARLLDAAADGELETDAQIEAQARRLLADPRARAMVGEFAAQWLGAERVMGVDKHAGLFPGFDQAKRASLLEETRSFVVGVIFDGTHQLGELFTAPQADPRRSGFLGHGSILATTAHSDQTSPIRRGLFVRRRLLCQELPPPPPDAGGVPDVDPSATTRERFRQHTDDPVCAGCHQYIDPVGFGFERFDAIGAWRDQENGQAIPTDGDMLDVERIGAETSAPFMDLPSLGETLAASEAASSCFVRQVRRFARGYRETLSDRCARLELEARLAASGGDIRELLVGLVISPDFRVRR